MRPAGGVRLRRERLELPDGDFLDLDWAEIGAVARTPAAPLVVVLHGLEGCAESGYALETYRALGRHGVESLGINFRSCSGVPNRLPRMYHSGDTGDLQFVLARLRQRLPTRPLGAIGFSLGGNVLLKYLGEEGQTGQGIVAAAVAISVPFELSAGADWLERGFARLYRRNLVRRLQRKVAAKLAMLDGKVDLAALRRARTFREFDDAGTAPLHGFADAEDYYRRSSAARYVAHIRTPTLILHAEDDPFLPARAVPREALAANPHLDVRISRRGGHVGFVAGPPWAPVFWAEREAAAWMTARLSVDQTAKALGAPPGRPGSRAD